MKNFLMFYYNLDVDNIEMQSNDIYSFYIDYNKFYLLRINRPKEDIDLIYKIVSETVNKYHYIIKNKFGTIYTENNGKMFILLKINGPMNTEVNLIDIISDQIVVNDDSMTLLSRSNWGDLWSRKVDYLEYQMSELGKNHQIAIKSFSYFVGLAENAIEYYNLLKIDKIPLVLSHRRIFYPNTSLNYYNPLDIVIDYRVRDISEYIKSCFFNGYDIKKDLDWLFSKNILSPLEYNLLYLRLLYPSYYFDDLNKVIEKNEDEDILLKYTDKINDYEKFLKDMYYEISKKSTLLKIDWILKRKS